MTGARAITGKEDEQYVQEFATVACSVDRGSGQRAEGIGFAVDVDLAAQLPAMDEITFFPHDPPNEPLGLASSRCVEDSQACR
jgi:hypothetical protein